jgi:hypothetical protein
MRRIVLTVAILLCFRVCWGQVGGRDITGELSIERVVQIGNLTIAFVASARQNPHAYTTLEDGLRTKTAVIHERNSQTLWIDNLGNADLFVQSGDLIKGGQQDRMIANDMILGAGDTTRDLEVFCIEEGRSTKRGAEPIETFSASEERAPVPHLRVMAKHEMTAKLLVPHLGGLTAPDPQQLQMLEQIASLPQTIQIPDPAQLSIWRDVRELQSSLTKKLKDSVTKNASPTSLQLALERAEASDNVSGVRSRIMDIDLTDSCVGYLYAVGDRIEGGDIYGGHGLFARMWPKLARALAIQSVAMPSVSIPTAGSTVSAKAAPAMIDFEDYLSHRGAGAEITIPTNKGDADPENLNPEDTSMAAKHRSRSEVHVSESSQSYLFETYDTKYPTAWVHREYVTK